MVSLFHVSLIMSLRISFYFVRNDVTKGILLSLEKLKTLLIIQRCIFREKVLLNMQIPFRDFMRQ